MIKITLNGEPKSTSHIYKYTAIGGYVRGYMSKEGVQLKESYALEAWHQYGGNKDPLDGPLSIECSLYFGTKRKADIDNFNKLWLDALSGIVWEDDSQVEELSIKKLYDKERPRIELAIRRCGTRSRTK